MALITSTLNNESNGYSIVNKNYLDLCSHSWVKCAVVDISNPSNNASYNIEHNLGTQNIILNAYNISSIDSSTILTFVEVAYNVPDNNNVIVTFNNIGVSNNIRIVIMGTTNVYNASVTEYNSL